MRVVVAFASLLSACVGDGGATADNYGTGGTHASGGSTAGGAGGSAGGGGGAGGSAGVPADAGGQGGDDGAAGYAGDAASGGAPAGGGAGGNAGQAGSGDPPVLDLSKVKWLHANVAGWPVTVALKSVSVKGGQVCMDHDIASKSWPIKTISGTEVVANPWVFIHEGGQWYGATWEWLRPPGQTCKAQSSVAGDHIKIAPFDAASGWKPSSGQTLYFMVIGLARGGLSNVKERSAPVKVVWP